MHATAVAAHAHWLLGRAGEADACARQALGTARELSHPYSLAVALAYAAVTGQLRSTGGPGGGPGPAVAELRELCERYDFGYYREWGLVLDGWYSGGPDGVELARRGIENLRRDGSFARMPYWLGLLAELQQQAGRPDRARSTLDAAIAAARARRELWWLPEVLRRRARTDDTAVAVARLREAAGLAAAQGSVTLERRCRADLAARSPEP